MYKFNTNIEWFSSELENIIKLFYGKILTSTEITANFDVEHNAKISINQKIWVYNFNFDLIKDNLENKRIISRFYKNCLYKSLSDYYGYSLPWGSLTGIRPTKLIYEYLEKGLSLTQARHQIEVDFNVNNLKSKLVCDVVKNQIGYINKQQNQINLYVHIPFCPSKCNYCSFLSLEVLKNEHFLVPYVDQLVVEINKAKDFLEKQNKKIYSVYIGGGTPTSLPDFLFEKVLNAIGKINVEYTCEAGRPETITKAKLDLMQKYGVNRISINPQTLNLQTLIKIKRNHTVEEFFNAYSLTKNYDFIINVDLIAGLEDETLNDFIYTLDEIQNLKPHNITIHTLSKKRGSILSQNNNVFELDGVTNAMTEYALNTLSLKNYLPYYLYRQKNMKENLENLGFCLNTTQCVNNITVMEESLSVFACGAGAISKRIYQKQGRIERFANVKDVKLYLETFDEKLKFKEQLFKD